MVAATIWGNQTAEKRVLLLHGLTSTSQFWHSIAEDFVSRGYFVTAPDLLGHGLAKRSSVYTIAAMAEELLPLLKAPGGGDHPYDVVIGHSLGGLIAAALLPHLASARPVRVVLIDPPFELPSECVAMASRATAEVIRNPPTPEAVLESHPQWTREQAVFESVGIQLCDIAAVEAICNQNDPWSFSQLLSMPPDNIKVIVLVADPTTKDPQVKEEDLKAYPPDVIVKTVWGASHMIPVEVPGVVLEAALQDESTEGTGISSGPTDIEQYPDGVHSVG